MEFFIEDGGLYKYSSESPESNVIIPDTVKEIGCAAFNGCDNITSVFIPDSVTQIWDYAFERCQNLKSVRLSKNITYIPSGAFEGCCMLEKIDIPEGVTSVLNCAFDGCQFLSEINFPKSLIHIGDNAFYNTEWLRAYDGDFVVANDILVKYKGTDTDVIVPNGIKIIGENAFGSNKKIHSVVLPNTVETIDWYAFKNCTKLKSVNIPEKVKTINYGAFSGCKKLRELILPESLKSLGSAFFECESIENIEIPEKIKKIEERTFLSCKRLKKVKLPKGLKKIGSDAFHDCIKLEKINIPDGVTVINDSTFAECSSLEKIVLPDSVKRINERAFVFCKNLKEINITENVKKIPNSCFKGCSSLKKIVIPDNIETISKDAFRECVSLEEVVLPQNVKISSAAFNETKWLENYPDDFVVFNEGILYSYKGKEKRIKIPEEITMIYEDAFDNTSLEQLTIPETVKYCVGNIFGKYGKIDTLVLESGFVDSTAFLALARNMEKDFWFENAKYIVLENHAISAWKHSRYKKSVILGFVKWLYEGHSFPEDVMEKNKRYIHNKRKDLYDIAIEDKNLLTYMFDEKIIPLEDVEMITEKTKDIELKSLLLNYSNTAFSVEEKEKFRLKQINLDPNSVSELRKRWNYIKRPDNTISITGYKGNDTTVYVPKKIGRATVTKIEGIVDARPWVFKNDDEICIEKIVMPDTITELAFGIFEYMDTLKAVRLSENLTVIPEYAFENCDSLESIVIPESVERIEDNAFLGCYNLKDIKFPEKINYISSNSFDITLWYENYQGDFVMAGPHYLYEYKGNDKKIVIPDGVEFVGCGCFDFEKGIEEIVVPNGVKSLCYSCYERDDYAVLTWQSLGEKEVIIRIPSSVTKIGKNFLSCLNKVNIIAPKNSYAIKFAKENGYKYTELDEE